MADNNKNYNDVDTTTKLDNDTEPATGHDIGIGGGIGAVGGAIVGGLAGGPLGAVIGAIVGGGASAGAVDIVDKHDHDYDRTVNHTSTTDTAPVYAAEPVVDETTPATAYTGPGDYQRTQNVATTDTAYADTTMPRTVGTETDRSVELHAEELHASKQAVQTGEVTLHKEVITETKSIDVPVTREEVVIERHAVSGGTAATANFDTQADEVIRVPVMEEQVTIQKTPIVTEEISLGKRQVTETQHVTDTVRHEEARIENPDNVDVLDR